MKSVHCIFLLIVVPSLHTSRGWLFIFYKRMRLLLFWCSNIVKALLPKHTSKRKWFLCVFGMPLSQFIRCTMSSLALKKLESLKKDPNWSRRTSFSIHSPFLSKLYPQCNSIAKKRYRCVILLLWFWIFSKFVSHKFPKLWNWNNELLKHLAGVEHIISLKGLYVAFQWNPLSENHFF